MASDDTTKREGPTDLGGRVGLLEERVAQLERRVGARYGSGAMADDRHASGIDADLAMATALNRVAILSFVLLGALILRVLTEQRILGVAFGTFLGFAYAGSLIVQSLLPGRLGRLARETSLFQCAGVVLSFSIALESAMRVHTMGRITATAITAAFGILALALATANRRAYLASTALVGAVLALMALGLEADGMAFQMACLVFFAAAATALSWRRDWAFLRPLVFTLFLLVVAIGFGIAHRQSFSRGPLLAGAIAFWAMIVVQHFLALRRLGQGAVWLPLTTLWLAGLAQLESGVVLPMAAAAVSVLAIVASAVVVRRSPDARAATAGLAATAVVAAMIGWTALDSSGVLCALAGVAVGYAIRPTQPTWATALSAILMVTAAVRGTLFLFAPAASLYTPILETALAAVLFADFLRADRVHADSPVDIVRALPSVVLVAGLVVLLAVARNVAHRLFPEPEAFFTVQTGILAVAAFALTLWGHAAHHRAIAFCGIGCMLVAIGKVGLIDVGRLKGLHLLISVVFLALSSVTVSGILRRGTLTGSRSPVPQG